MRKEHPIYSCITIEFCQPWDILKFIQLVKEQKLGNMVCLSHTFHVGNSKKERDRWKKLYPEVAEQIDATPVFPERPKYGMARLIDMPLDFWIQRMELCRKLGLKLLISVPMLKDSKTSLQDIERVRELEKQLLLGDILMSESTSMMGNGYSMEQLNAINQSDKKSAGDSAEETGRITFENPDSLDLQIMHDWFIDRFLWKAKKLRSLGVKNIISIESSPQLRLAMEAGTDVPILELVPHGPVTGIASVRGTAKAYGKDFWGVHTAMGYYRAPEDDFLSGRLAIAYNSFYAGGSSIFSEPNMALGHWGLCSGFFTIKASPPIITGEKEYRGLNDPISVRSRKFLSEHYHFTQFHNRPENGPRVNLGFVFGNLDGTVINEQQEYVWCVKDDTFKTGNPELMWNHYEKMFSSEDWYTPPRKYYWQADPCKALKYGTPPCGQLDIVPVEAPLNVLKTYGCLVYLGWNTMTEEQYVKIKEYVKAGGNVFMSVPHLSTQLKRDREPEIINEGDISDLFGVRVKGKGVTNEDILIVEQTRNKKYSLPKGALYLEEIPLADVEITTGKILAKSRNGETVLVENKCGKGYAYLLTVWEYPGRRLDAFITDILRTLAEGEQDDVTLTGRDVEYAVYDGKMPSGEKYSVVYLVNKDVYGQSKYPELGIRTGIRTGKIPVRIDGYKMRISWITADLFFSPEDRFVRIDDIVRAGNYRELDISAEPGQHTLQVAGIKKNIKSAVLNGKKCVIQVDREGITSIKGTLLRRNILRIVLKN